MSDRPPTNRPTEQPCTELNVQELDVQDPIAVREQMASGGVEVRDGGSKREQSRVEVARHVEPSCRSVALYLTTHSAWPSEQKHARLAQ